MTTQEFLAKYANTPLDDRDKILDFDDLSIGTLTLNSVYYEINRLEEFMRPMRIRQEKILKAVEPFLTKKR